MKEATGELSTTVIAIVAIAAILAIFTAFLLPTLRAQIALTQACNNGPGYKTTENGYTICCDGGGAGITCSTNADSQKACNSGNEGAATYNCYYTNSNKDTQGTLNPNIAHLNFGEKIAR